MADDIPTAFQSILDEVRSGEWDERLDALQHALDFRKEFLKSNLLARVKEVFGPDAEVVVSGQQTRQRTLSNTDIPNPDHNPFVRKAKMDDAPIIKEPMPELDSLEDKMVQEAAEGPTIGRGGALIGGMGPQDFQ